jgi:hypothetical protein
MFEFFFKYFLVFPKIQLGGEDTYSGFGILIGEIFLILYAFRFLLFHRRILLNTPLVVLMVFLAYFIFLSSLLNWPFAEIFPVMSGAYYLRILLYVSLFVFAFNYSETDTNLIVQRFYVTPFLIQCVGGTIIVVTYYLTHNPSIGDVLWGYDTGLRLIPFAGLSFNPDAFFFLMPIGGGSANLLASWALAVLIIADQSISQRMNLVIFMVIFTVALSMSRGGLLTICLYLIYMSLRDWRTGGRLILVFGMLGLIISLFAYLTESENSIFANIFTRLSDTFEQGGLDGSSLGRLENYSKILSVWIESPFFVLFGMGYDEAIMRSYTGYSIVESFILQVITSSGLIGLTGFVLFYVVVYKMSTVNLWFACLWKFLIFESILQWSITGGDFVSPHVLFVFMTFLGFGYNELCRQAQSPQVQLVK